MSRFPQVVLVVALLSPFAATLACGGAETPPAVAPPTTSPGASGAPILVTDVNTPASNAAPSAPPSASAAAPPADSAKLGAILTTDVSQLAAIVAAAASAQAPKMLAPAAAKDPEKGLTGVATKAAQGMKPDGAIATHALKEGEHLAWTVSMAPGKCYAIVGYSPNGEVQDLDLHLLAPPLYAMMSGEDETDDNAPIIGRAPNPMCPVVAVHMPYKVDVVAEKGAGRVALQLFSKPK